MGLVSKGVKCNVSGCDEDSVRSLNTQKVEVSKKNPPHKLRIKATKKSKKKDESSGPPKAEIVVILTDEQIQKYLKGAKVITSSEVAKQCGVKISAASKYLKNAVLQGKMSIAGGYSGHHIYKPSK